VKFQSENEFDSRNKFSGVMSHCHTVNSASSSLV